VSEFKYPRYSFLESKKKKKKKCSPNAPQYKQKLHLEAKWTKDM